MPPLLITCSPPVTRPLQHTIFHNRYSAVRMSNNASPTKSPTTVAGCQGGDGISPNKTTIEENGDDDECGMIVVDDDGVPIDPAAEGSFMMAEGLSLLMMQQGQEDNQGGFVLEPYVPDFDVDEARARSMAFFSRHNSAVDAIPPLAHTPVPAPSGDAAISGPHPAVGTEEDDEDYNEEEEEEEDQYDEEDDFPTMGSRDMTDPDDWVLEAILKRRMNKEDPAGGPWIYLCKWKGHDEPTWETREVMEEAGWIPQLDAFDARGVHHNMKKQKDPNDWAEYDDDKSAKKKKDCEKRPKPKAPYHLPCEAMDRLEEFLASGNTPPPRCKLPAPRVDYHDERTIQINQRKSVVDSSAASDPFSSCNDATSTMTSSERCAALINQMNRKGLFTSGFQPTRYARMNTLYVESFLKRWEQRKETHFPVIVFHGTRLANLNSIHSSSLLAGGTKGVRVVNGTAYGNGVYSATTTGLPLSYGECRTLLLCAGLVPIATMSPGSFSSYSSSVLLP